MYKLKLGKHTSGMYLLDVETNSKEITDLKQVKLIGNYRIMLKLRVNGKLSSKTFTFPKRKTVAKAIEDVNDKRKELKQKLAKDGTLRDKKKQENAPLTFSKAWESLFAIRKTHLREASLRTYQSDYHNFLGALKDRVIYEITVDDLQDIVTGIINEGYAVSTAVRVLAGIKPVFKKAKHLIDWSEIKLPKYDNKRHFTLSLEKTKLLVHTMKNHYRSDVRDIFIWLLHGRRIGEVMSMRWEHIDLERMEYVITQERSKSHKELVYAIDDELLEVINRAPKTISGLLYSVSIVTVRRHLDIITDSLNLPRMRLHDIRHLVGTMLYQNGVPIADIARVLGHSSIQTTISRYVTDSKDQATRALTAFNELMD